MALRNIYFDTWDEYEKFVKRQNEILRKKDEIIDNQIEELKRERIIKEQLKDPVNIPT